MKAKKSYWSKERFNAARKRGRFTMAENAKAADWTTCACGQNSDPRIPMRDDGGPRDMTLFRLGLDFQQSVNVGDVDVAELTLACIEARAAWLITHKGKGAR